MNHHFFQKFLDNTHNLLLFKRSDLLLLGVSGGLDSMVLCHLLLDLGFRFELAHVNFHLRGTESDGDARFIHNFAQSHDLVFHQLDVDAGAFAKKEKISIQESARQLRYEWFEEKRKEIQADWVLVAHQKDDIAETVIFNLTRGTGMAGLHGIKPKNGCVVRPLLFAERREILAFAKEQEIEWREDSSNQKTKYSRNLIRHKVIPLLQEINPSLIQTMAHNAQIMSELELMLGEYVAAAKKHFVSKDGDQIRVQLVQISQLVSAKSILYYLIREYGFNESHTKDILSSGATGKVFLSDQKRAVIHGADLLITDFAEGLDMVHQLESWSKESIQTPEFSLSWEIKPYHGQKIPDDDATVWLASDDLVFPLILRKRKAGDRFQPFGMGGKSKKLKDFLSSLKLSIPAKEMVWILETADGKICWVADYRTDERFRVHANTKNVLEISIKIKDR